MTPFSELGDLGLRFAINLISAAILILGMFLPRHRDRDLAVTAGMFNVFAFAVLYKLSSVEFSLAAGFGLFAILALFNLRSEPIGRIQIAYFFGAVAIAVICSVAGTPTLQMIAVVVTVLVGVYLIDHPRVLRGSRTLRVTLDHIDPELTTDPIAMQKILSTKIAADVTGYEIESLNYANNRAVVSLTFSKHS